MEKMHAQFFALSGVFSTQFFVQLIYKLNKNLLAQQRRNSELQHIEY